MKEKLVAGHKATKLPINDVLFNTGLFVAHLSLFILLNSNGLFAVKLTVSCFEAEILRLCNKFMTTRDRLLSTSD